MGAAESDDARDGAGCLRWLHMSVLACSFGAMIAYRPAQTSPFAELEGDVPGSPFVGHAFELLRDSGGRNSWLAARCREHGAVSRLYMMGDDCVLLCGAKMASVFASPDLVDHDAADNAVPRAQLWLASPHRVSATAAAQRAAAYSRAAADRLEQITTTVLQQDALAALLAVASANESPTEVGRELQPHVFKMLWRTLFASDGMALQQTYLDVARDTMSCLPIDIGSALFPSAWPESLRWHNCFSKANTEKRQHLLPVLLDEIRVHRQSLGPVLGGDEAQTPEDAMATAEAAHDFIIRTLHSSAMVLTHAFQALAADQVDAAGDSTAASGGVDSTAVRAHQMAIESRRLVQLAAWSYGVARSDLKLSSFHSNVDCHADCPSCSTPCQPYTTEHVVPTGTQLIMAWNTLDTDQSADAQPPGADAGAGDGVGHEVNTRTGSSTMPMAGMGHSAGQADATDAIVEHVLRVAIRAMEQGQLQVVLPKEPSRVHPQTDETIAKNGGVKTLVVAATQ